MNYFFYKERNPISLDEASFSGALPTGRALVSTPDLTGFLSHVYSCQAEKHEEPAPMGSPDSHAVSEGQKSVGVPKTTRKGKEKSAEKEKLAKEKQAPRFEPQGVAHTIYNLLRNRASGTSQMESVCVGGGVATGRKEDSRSE